MKKLTSILIFSMLIVMLAGIAGCKDENDDGIPNNTLVINGSSLAMSSVTCTQHGSGFLLQITASDLTLNNVLLLQIRDIPTVEQTVTFSAHSGAEAWGTYTVNNTVDYFFQNGTATITPLTATTFSVTFENITALANGTVQATVSFNGSCN
jgi:hypothetical protein